jgi:hypothetical protein
VLRHDRWTTPARLEGQGQDEVYSASSRGCRDTALFSLCLSSAAVGFLAVDKDVESSMLAISSTSRSRRDADEALRLC